MKRLSIVTTSKFLMFSLATVAVSLMSIQSATAATFDLSFTKLSGVTGGNPQGTAVYHAQLSNIGFDNISSILIGDSNIGTGGEPGKFSGFDLDAIKLSRTSISSASGINSITGLNLFDFSPTGTVFTPGTKRPTANPALSGNLFGTTGDSIDNSVATLQNFDGNSVTNTNAFGYASLGDGGQVGFNLTSPVSTRSSLYLYIGEVGDNGEVATVQITVSDEPIRIPEPTSLAALSLMGIYFTVRCTKRAKAQ
ncbi:hypothetical protein A6770_10155 [Nostoc minutum NIES-26]|uniref:PEP-CTERM sorting domain-containing protein n=1 Tax=Nostoc minutum NIES-26 TaxID=1844469 RepID=A0A367RYF3_9NOSO|nr:hypothetical protein A6770_10155 [Nostoc minutum NIES-26]